MADSIWKAFLRTLGLARADADAPPPRTPSLSKSRYLTGLQCERRLWLSWHDPEKPRATPAGSIFAVGHEVGCLAHELFPGGILVGGGPAEFEAALRQTEDLIADTSVKEIFEAAFVFDGVRVRADVIERSEDGRWVLNEVKSSASVKPENLHDLAIQTYVLEGSGLKVARANLVHINTGYVRGAAGIEARGVFSIGDATADVRALLVDVRSRVRGMHKVLALSEAPFRRPSRHCFSPYECEFWGRCTSAKPEDWIWTLPRLRPDQFDALEAAGVEAITAIPDDFQLTSQQRRVVEAWRRGDIVVQPGLAAVLPTYEECGYLDFETLSPALPLYQGSRPYRREAAQWSLHRRKGGVLSHAEFLADLQTDPARAFAEALLSASAFEGPIFVYSAFERSVVRELALKFPDLAAGLGALESRFVDLLPVVRSYIDHPRFSGSNSIKAVAPVLAPDVTYDDLETIADGAAASEALYRLATKQFETNENEPSLRRALLEYCKLDTLALARVHEALEKLAAQTTTGE